MQNYHQNKSKSLFEEEFTLSELSKMGNPLEFLSKCLDFELFREKLESVLVKEDRRSNAGRRPFDPVMMIKVMFIQRMYCLSDAQTEYQIKDRTSFRQFLGISSFEDVPDEKTIWKYREIFSKAGTFDELFNIFLSHLKGLGMEMTEGKMVDASFVVAPRQRNTKEENKKIKEGKGDELWKDQPNKKRQKDVDARWVKKRGERFYGYKDHVKVDKKTKIITNYSVTSANVHDSKEATALIQEEDKGQNVWFDSGYTGLEGALTSKGVIPIICEKGFRNHPLTETQKENNKKKSVVRSRVEHVFGFMEQSMRGLVFRGVGIVRAKANIAFTNMVYNMCRYSQILRYNPEWIVA